MKNEEYDKLLDNIDIETTKISEKCMKDANTSFKQVTYQSKSRQPKVILEFPDSKNNNQLIEELHNILSIELLNQVKKTS